MSKKNLVNNIASLGVVQIANFILPLISIPIISRIIGPEKFGIITFCAAFVTYFNILISYGFGLTATRTIAQDPDNYNLRNKVFSEVLQAQFFLFIVSALLFMICLYLVPPLRKEKEVAIFSFLFCIGSLFTQNWLFQAMQELSKVALLDFMCKLLFTVVILTVVHEKKDYIWQPLVTSLVQIFVALGSFIWAIKKYKIQFVKIKIKEILFLLRKDTVVFLSLILISFYTTTNTIILGLFQSSEQVGYYMGAQKLIFVAYAVVSLPISTALFPFIGKAFAENREKGIVTVQKIIPFIVLITLSMGIAMIIFGPWALRLFYGKQFEPSVLAFQLLVFTPMFIAIGNIFGIQIMLNLKMDKLFFKITICGAIISIVGNVLLINKFGYLGTALDWLFTEMFITITMYVILRLKGINPIDINQFRPKFMRAQFEPLFNKFRYSKKLKIELNDI